MAEVTKVAEKGMGNAKYWIGGLVILVIVLAAYNWMYMKKIKELEQKPATDAKPSYATKEAPKTATTNDAANSKVSVSDMDAPL